MASARLVFELDTLVEPIDIGIVALEPSHTDDGIVARQGNDSEGKTIGVGTDTNLGRLEDGASLLLMAIGESDEAGGG